MAVPLAIIFPSSHLGRPLSTKGGSVLSLTHTSICSPSSAPKAMAKRFLWCQDRAQAIPVCDHIALCKLAPYLTWLFTHTPPPSITLSN